jgi:hypothetical protein
VRKQQRQCGSVCWHTKALEAVPEDCPLLTNGFIEAAIPGHHFIPFDFDQAG